MFTKVHTKKGTKEFVHPKAKRIADDYEKRMAEAGPSQTPEEFQKKNKIYFDIVSQSHSRQLYGTDNSIWGDFGASTSTIRSDIREREEMQKRLTEMEAREREREAREREAREREREMREHGLQEELDRLRASMPDMVQQMISQVMENMRLSTPVVPRHTKRATTSSRTPPLDAPDDNNDQNNYSPS